MAATNFQPDRQGPGVPSCSCPDLLLTLGPLKPALHELGACALGFLPCAHAAPPPRGCGQPGERCLCREHHRLDPSPLASAHLSAADRIAIFCTELRTCVGGWVELRLERSALRRVWVLPPGLFSVVTQGRNSSGIPRVDTVPGASLGPQHLGQGSPFALR